jgi:hypothetical protein
MNPQLSRLMEMEPREVVRRIGRLGWRAYHKFRTRKAPAYRNPSDLELAEIESRLVSMGMPCQDMVVSPEEFDRFIDSAGFPPDYHGGHQSGVYREKLLEHYLAWKVLGLEAGFRAPYLDVAACASPWARLLRDSGIEAYAIDLAIADEFAALPYYRREDATATTFPDASMGGASLQCAYEMFVGEQDIGLLFELGRILKPGGRAVISPLYMHTHACYYQTPEFYGQPYGDRGATGYVRRDTWGVPCSRKYSPETLKSRVWDEALQAGLIPTLHVLRNKGAIAEGIYMHFILVLERQAHSLSSLQKPTP